MQLCSNGIGGILGALGCRFDPWPSLHCGLRIWHCHSCGIGHKHGSGSDPWPRKSMCCGPAKKKRISSLQKICKNSTNKPCKPSTQVHQQLILCLSPRVCLIYSQYHGHSQEIQHRHNSIIHSISNLTNLPNNIVYSFVSSLRLLIEYIQAVKTHF